MYEKSVKTIQELSSLMTPDEVHLYLVNLHISLCIFQAKINRTLRKTQNSQDVNGGNA